MFCTCLWVSAVAMLWAGQSRLVFMTGLSRQYTSPIDHKIFSEYSVAGADGIELRAVSIRTASDEDGYWILFCPPAGASTRVQMIQGQLRELSSLGYNVFAFDYRGFGDSAGEPSEQGLYADALTGYRYLNDTMQVPASRIILAGRSLGTTIAVDLATRVDAAGLILFSPIDSVPATAARLYPWATTRTLSSYRFDSRAKAARVTVPVLVLTGSGDPYLPLADARSLIKEFRGPTLLVQTAGGHHHSGFVTIADLYRGMKAFWP